MFSEKRVAKYGRLTVCLTEHELEVLEERDVDHGAEYGQYAALVPLLLHPRQVHQGRAGHHPLLIRKTKVTSVFL